jgi:hypothetical protein
MKVDFVGWIHYQCQLNIQLLCIDLERVVLVVNEVISRSLECVGAEVQCRGLTLCDVDALAGQQRR